MYPEQIFPPPASPHVRRVLVITTQMRAALAALAAPAALALIGPLSLAPNRYVRVNACSSFEFHVPKDHSINHAQSCPDWRTNFAITAPFGVYVLALLVLTGHRSPQLVLKARSRNNELSSWAKARRMCEGRKKNDWTSGEYGRVTE